MYPKEPRLRTLRATLGLRGDLGSPIKPPARTMNAFWGASGGLFWPQTYLLGSWTSVFIMVLWVQLGLFGEMIGVYRWWLPVVWPMDKCSSVLGSTVYLSIYIHTYTHTDTRTYIHALHCITLHYITLHYITLHTCLYVHTSGPSTSPLVWALTFVKGVRCMGPCFVAGPWWCMMNS